MTRLTHHERSQNWRALVLSLTCLTLLLGIAATSDAHAEQAAPTAPATQTASVPHSYYKFFYNHVCIRDNSWGTFYPAVIATIANQLNAPRDLDVDLFPRDWLDVCANRFQDRQIVRFGLIPAANAHLYNWCVNGNSPIVGGSQGIYDTYGEHVEIYYNFARAGCSDGDLIKANLSYMFAGRFGLKGGNYGSLYSVMNRDRFPDIPYMTANDLPEFNEIY